MTSQYTYPNNLKIINEHGVVDSRIRVNDISLLSEYLAYLSNNEKVKAKQCFEFICHYEFS
jgi:hypothetical protein